MNHFHQSKIAHSVRPLLALISVEIVLDVRSGVVGVVSQHIPIYHSIRFKLGMVTIMENWTYWNINSYCLLLMIVHPVR